MLIFSLSFGIIIVILQSKYNKVEGLRSKDERYERSNSKI